MQQNTTNDKAGQDCPDERSVGRNQKSEPEVNQKRDKSFEGYISQQTGYIICSPAKRPGQPKTHFTRFFHTL